MKKISIYNSYIKDNQTKREAIANKLKQNGFIPSRNGELLIVIGGDGTFLSAVHKRFDQNPIFVGFNAGNLGFLSEFSMDEMDEFIKILKKEDYWIQEIPVYEVHYKEHNVQRVEYFMNDFVVERKGTRILHMGVQVGTTNVGTVSGDGVVLSTNLGSTGYNMSAGGAVSLSRHPLLQMAPIASVQSRAYQTFPNSLLIDAENDITIFPNIKKQRPFRLVCDGKEIRTKNIRFVEVKKSEKVVRVLRSKGFNPIEHLKHKMLTFE